LIARHVTMIFLPNHMNTEHWNLCKAKGRFWCALLLLWIAFVLQ